MRAVCQRVSEARVRVDDSIVGEIGTGLVVLLGVREADTATDAHRLAAKVAALRIFPNDAGRFDRSIVDIAGAALVVSQSTLIADTRRGNRPSFSDAAAPEQAEALYDQFTTDLGGTGVPVSRGRFGTKMAVELVNDGPVTIVLDEPPLP
jgi:D-tyrosyl-tRNA(Tyr) deacylase